MKSCLFLASIIAALSTTTALKEAQLAISKMQGYKVSYPVVYDLEYAKASKLSAKTVSEMALTFCNEVRRAGYYPMVYCNTNWYDNYIDWSLLSGVDVWIARYGDTIQSAFPVTVCGLPYCIIVPFLIRCLNRVPISTILEATVYVARMECTKTGKKVGSTPIISGKTEKRIRDG